MGSKYNYDKYESFQYTGFQGFLMRYSHKWIARNFVDSKNKTLLDIGGGAKPHNQIIRNEFKEYFISDQRKILTESHKKKLLSKNNYSFHIWDDDKNQNYFKKNNVKFDYIIASHVWEHVQNPEDVLIRWVHLLKKNGVLILALPCDPGLFWRAGQIFARSKAKKVLNLNPNEYDLIMSREHINPIQNLIKIINYYSPKSKIKFYPFNFFRFSLINIFLFASIKKQINSKFIYES